jgi:hypothetical protein
MRAGRSIVSKLCTQNEPQDTVGYAKITQTWKAA